MPKIVYNRGMNKTIIALLSACVAVSLHGAGSVVRIEGSTGAWRLTFNGKPYFIKGGGGGGSKALLKEIGGNSFRTWGAHRRVRNAQVRVRNAPVRVENAHVRVENAHRRAENAHMRVTPLEATRTCAWRTRIGASAV